MRIPLVSLRRLKQESASDGSLSALGVLPNLVAEKQELLRVDAGRGG